MAEHQSDTVCGLDIGSNTFSVCELRDSCGTPQIVRDQSLAVRLSEGLVQGGKLKPAAVVRGLHALEQIVDSFNTRGKPLRAVGTAGLRLPSDPEQFLKPAQEILGVPVEVLSGEQEALLVRQGALLGLTSSSSWTVVDLGGQSTELSWSLPNGVVQPLSLSFGAVGLTTHYLDADPPDAVAVESMRRAIAGLLQNDVPTDLAGDLLAVAGTATTFAAVELGLERWQPERIHGIRVHRSRLEYWIDQLIRIPAGERTARYGIGARRADVFPAGLCVLAGLMDHLKKDEITISVYGLRVGAALSLLAK